MDKTKWFLDIIDSEGKVVKSVIIDDLLSEAEMQRKALHIIRSYPWNKFQDLDYAISRFV